MKRFLICFAVPIAMGAHADDPSPFKSGDELAAEVQRNCADGCLVLNRQEAAQLMEQVNAMLAERTQRAYTQGARSCRNAV
jgi:hypothetical protein